MPARGPKALRQGRETTACNTAYSIAVIAVSSQAAKPSHETVRCTDPFGGTSHRSATCGSLLCPRWKEARLGRFADRGAQSLPAQTAPPPQHGFVSPMSHSPISPASLSAGGNGAGWVSGWCNNMDLPHKKEQDVLARRCAHTANACQERAPSICRDLRHDQGDELAKSRLRERLESLRSQSVQGIAGPRQVCRCFQALRGELARMILASICGD